MWRIFYESRPGLRLVTSAPVKQLLYRAEERFDAITSSWFQRLDAYTAESKTAGIIAKCIVGVMGIAIVGSMVWMGSQRNVRPEGLERKPSLINRPINDPSATAALKFPDGSIQSGDATIVKERDGRYVVTFSKSQ